MNSVIVIPVLVSFLISVALGPVVIPFLRRLKVDQTEREEGVKSHLKKAGTPTMGGVIFLIATTVTSLFFVKDYPRIAPILFLMLGFGLIGFLDDYLKVVLHRSDGLLAWQKMLCQIFRRFVKTSDPVFRGKGGGYWLAGGASAFYRRDRHGQRRQLYRRP